MSDPPNYVNLGVPFHKSFYVDSCGAACVQMWAEFLGYSHTQTEIQLYMGILGGAPTYLANAATNFCKQNIIVDAHSDQDRSIADHLNSMRHGSPCIPIINYGTHFVITNKVSWHREENGRPFIEKIWCHDPDYYYPCKNAYYSIATWKSIYKSSSDGLAYITIIHVAYAHNSEAKYGLDEFRAQGGTYYGEHPGDDVPPIEY